MGDLCFDSPDNCENYGTDQIGLETPTSDICLTRTYHMTTLITPDEPLIPHDYLAYSDDMDKAWWYHG